MMRLLALCVLCLLPGCGGYTITGRAVEGPASMIAFVDPDDPRLQQRGVGAVQIDIVRDPMKLNREVVARASSSGTGEFEIPIAAFGAGWMEEAWQIRAARRGYGSATALLPLPSAKSQQVLLIVMAEGLDGFDDDIEFHEELMQQYDRFK